MKIKSISFFATIFVLAGVLFLAQSALVRAAELPDRAGLIPCGGPTDPCTLCHLIVGIHGLVQYGIGIITAICFAAIFFAGVMYIISVGDEGMMKSAKSFLSSALIGFAVVMSAWLIVTVVIWVLAARPSSGITGKGWATFSCSAR